jgi:hypothetical protein
MPSVADAKTFSLFARSSPLLLLTPRQVSLAFPLCLSHPSLIVPPHSRKGSSRAGQCTAEATAAAAAAEAEDAAEAVEVRSLHTDLSTPYLYCLFIF